MIETLKTTSDDRHTGYTHGDQCMRKISDDGGDHYRFSSKWLLCIVFSVLSLSFTQTAWSNPTGDIQWHKQSGTSTVNLRRKNGDALGIRQRLIEVDQRPFIIDTEISHLTSGCALTLKWQLPQNRESSEHLSSHHMTMPQNGARQLAQSISTQLWPDLQLGH